MNCLPTISVAMALLSLTAGMWLLYKSKKEVLGTFFKVVAWFIIVVSMCLIVCCGMRCMMHCCMAKQDCSSMQQCGPDGMMQGGCEKMSSGCNMPCCKMMRDKNCSMADSADCCKKGEKILVKDSIVIKE
jgi:hypothetical protein